MIAVLDYGIGNLASAQKAFVSLGADAVLTPDPGEVAGAEGVVLPGVGSFGRCMEALRASGLDAAARDAIAAGTPFLGICVGFQMLYESSTESPGVAGLGVLAGTVVPLPPGRKVPQMQWNVLEPAGDRPSAMLDGLGERPWVYFVHSYAPVPAGFTAAPPAGFTAALPDGFTAAPAAGFTPGSPERPGESDNSGGVVAVCDYGGAVVAAVERGNVWGVQFHPEKSGSTGLTLLGNFVRRCVAVRRP